MKKILATGIALLMFVSINISNVNAQADPDLKGRAKAFVQEFYDEYLLIQTSLSKAPGNDNSYATILKKHPDHFDSLLTKALMVDRNAQVEAKGEIVGLDMDPFLNAQDTGWQYKVGNVTQNNGRYRVNVHLIENGSQKMPVLRSRLIVIAEVRKSNLNWVFTDFIYPEEGTDKKTSLKQLLADLQEARLKYAKK